MKTKSIYLIIGLLIIAGYFLFKSFRRAAGSQNPFNEVYETL